MDNRWTKMAVLSSVNEEVIDLLDALLGFPETKLPGAQEFLSKLIFLLGARNQSTEIERALDRFRKIEDPALISGYFTLWEKVLSLEEARSERLTGNRSRSHFFRRLSD